MALNREGFEKSALPNYKTINVAELGEVRLKKLTQAAYMEHLSRLEGAPEETTSEKDGYARLFPSVLTAGVVDDENNAVFSGIDDPLFKQLSPTQISEIGNALLAFWGFDKMETPEERLKNSEAARTDSALTS